jgi:hypothetical protein
MFGKTKTYISDTTLLVYTTTDYGFQLKKMKVVWDHHPRIETP